MILFNKRAEADAMMGRLAHQEQLSYRFRIEDHVPTDHLLRQIDPFLDVDDLRPQLDILPDAAFPGATHDDAAAL